MINIYGYLYKIRWIFLLLLLACLVFVVALYYGFFDIEHVEFNDIDDAKKKNYWRAGSFLPQWIPETSQMIRLDYDFDTNYRHVILKYDSQEEYKPPQECRLVNTTTYGQFDYECRFVDHPYVEDCKLKIGNGEFDMECFQATSLGLNHLNARTH